jgi:hypothetical protein
MKELAAAKAELGKHAKHVQSTMQQGTDVSELKQFVKDTRRMEKDLRKRVRQVGRDVAKRTVVPEAQRLAAKSRTAVSGNTTHLGSRGVGSIRATQSSKGGAVRGGGARVPYFMGHEWGSKQYAQFPGKTKEGHVIYPAIRNKTPDFIEEYWKEIEKMWEGN